MRQKWIEDELRWHKLPARAWPPTQPDAEDIPQIREDLAANGCLGADGDGSGGDATACHRLRFDLATALLFNNIDPDAALGIYEQLRRQGSVDAAVAMGIILVEGLGVDNDEPRGVELLQEAVRKGHIQGCYELGSALFLGVEEAGLAADEEAAFQLFERAAAHDHMGAMYMVADCLLEAVGTGGEPEAAARARAVPLLHGAAIQGHRTARRTLLGLLDDYAAAKRKREGRRGGGGSGGSGGGSGGIGGGSRGSSSSSRQDPDKAGKQVDVLLEGDD